jgi:hypothetical protein
MPRKLLASPLFLTVVLVVAVAATLAQTSAPATTANGQSSGAPEEGASGDLQKATQNPVADLISFPRCFSVASLTRSK